MVIVDRSDGTRKSIALLTFIAGGRPSQCFSPIGVRGLFSSPLLVLRKRLELTRNPSVSHVFGSAEQGPRGFEVLLANHVASTITQLEKDVGTFGRLRAHY
ncbi:hypothetical protein [Bradyrhizobium erythrophlei]|jgi:hypothetical protein|uniref:hypothetical protein n=1 Tax=Bradyrhizobium erythrophlei TaxID=1437360 RepID=UPI0009A7945C|nr:hypothetical protein [Bradyrhizobium erythrophlei]